jgi:hypothetical protein
MASDASSPPRDMYTEATSDLAEHIGSKVVAILRLPENQARIQSVLDPIISHIINRIFPYILLSAILFLILLLLTLGTFWMVMRGVVSGGGGAAVSVVA